MSRFNAATLPVAQRSGDTTNLAGGEAFQQSPKQEFAHILLTSMVKNQFYRGADDTLARVVDLVVNNKVDPEFAAKAAIYARNEFGMRSITHVVAALVARNVKGEEWTRRFFDAVVRRPDDMTETVAYYLSQYGKPLPNSLKKGFAAAFDKFDGYQLAKYRGEGKAVSLVDVVNLVHPRSTPKNRKALRDLVNDKLRSTGTWEAKLSSAGQGENVEEAKTEAWTDLLVNRTIGYFALLRNLRNIESQAPDLVPIAAELLVDEKLIRNSLVLPFRFMTALGKVSNRTLVAAISLAIDISLRNVPTLAGKTLVVIDHSGSMGYGVGSPKFIGDLFAAALYKANDADAMVFGTGAGYVRRLNPTDSTLTVARHIGETVYGHGTNFHAIFQAADKKYDRMVIFSDMQGWVGYTHPGSALAEYSKQFKAKPYIYSFDLGGYGTTQFPEDRVVQIAGFSEKVFDLMKLLEQDPSALVRKIESVSF